MQQVQLFKVSGSFIFLNIVHIFRNDQMTKRSVIANIFIFATLC